MKRPGLSSGLRKALAKRRPLLTRKGKEAKATTTSVRLTPRLRYLAEIAARKQHRTLSKFVAWAIQEALRNVQLGDGPYSTVALEGSWLWDEIESERLAKLAKRYPHLLDHTEQALWRMIESSPELSVNGRLDHALLQRRWDKLLAVARGEEDSAALRDRAIDKNK